MKDPILAVAKLMVVLCVSVIGGLASGFNPLGFLIGAGVGVVGLVLLWGVCQIGGEPEWEHSRQAIERRLPAQVGRRRLAEEQEAKARQEAQSAMEVEFDELVFEPEAPVIPFGHPGGVGGVGDEFYAVTLGEE